MSENDDAIVVTVPRHRAPVVVLVIGATVTVAGLVLAILAPLEGFPMAAAVGGRLGVIAGGILAVLGLLLVRRARANAPSPLEKQEVEPLAATTATTPLGEVPLTRLGDTAQKIAALCSKPELDAIALVRELLLTGFAIGASDLHLTPRREGLDVAYRVDGLLHDVILIQQQYAPYVVNRVKVMSRLLLHERQRPQDGRIMFDRADLQARVSTLPTSDGEKVVIRLAYKKPSRYRLDAIGFPAEVRPIYEALLMRDHGVICLTGPTGSGKTTTMYASVLHVREQHGPKVNVVTLEDPIEMDFPGISQTEVNTATGLTFALGLRSVLRQDPNVIMVGEIRDEETAQTAFRAGLTGHLLLTTVHADSTVGVYQRLRQLRVEPVQLASASLAVVNQRLAIRNCADCTREIQISDAQKRQLELLKIDPTGPFFSGAGCEACNAKGRRGRVPLIELLVVDDKFRDLLMRDQPSHKLLEAAVEGGMVTLNEQVLRQARAGVLPVDEIVRVLSL